MKSKVVAIELRGPDAQGYFRGVARLGDLFSEVTVLPPISELDWEIEGARPHDTEYRVTADGVDMGLAESMDAVGELLRPRLVPH